MRTLIKFLSDKDKELSQIILDEKAYLKEMGRKCVACKWALHDLRYAERLQKQIQQALPVLKTQFRKGERR